MTTTEHTGRPKRTGHDRRDQLTLEEQTERWQKMREDREAELALEEVPPAGFEPAVSCVKGRRPGPLDDGGVGLGLARG